MVVLVLLGALALRIWVIQDPDLHPWDERFHALVGLHMADDPLKPTLHPDPAMPYDYWEWTNNHVWLHKPPMALWSIGASTAVFGNAVWAVRVPSVVYGWLTVLLTGLLARRWFGTWAALWALFLAAINPTALELIAGRSSTDHVDTAFCFWVALSVHFGHRWVRDPRWHKVALLGLAGGMAVLSKWATALLVGPLVLVMLLQSPQARLPKAWMQGVFGFVLVLLLPGLWSWWTQTQYPLEAAWESEYNRLHLWEALEGHKHGPFWHVRWLFLMFGPAGMAGLVLGLIWPFRLWRKLGKHEVQAGSGAVQAQVGEGADQERMDRSPFHQGRFRLLVPALYVFLPLLIFSLAATKMSHYLYVAAPAMWAFGGWVLAMPMAWAARGWRERVWRGQNRPEGLSPAGEDHQTPLHQTPKRVALWRSTRVRYALAAVLLVVVFWKPADEVGRLLDRNARAAQPAPWHDEMRQLEALADRLRAERANPRTVFYQVADQTVAMFHTEAEAYGWVPPPDDWAMRDTSRLHVVVHAPDRPLAGWVDTGACCPDVRVVWVD